MLQRRQREKEAKKKQKRSSEEVWEARDIPSEKNQQLVP